MIKSILTKLITGIGIYFLVMFALKMYRAPKFAEGEKAIAYEANLIDGTAFNSESMKGHYVLLDFWGSWCGPCRKESPDLVKLYDQYANKNYTDAQSFEIISIAIETNENRWKQAIEKDDLHWPTHIVQLDRFSSPLAKLYGVKEIPTKYLLDTEGNIIKVNPKFEEIRQFLDSKSKT